MKTSIVTGASSGLGREAAGALAGRGDRLWLVGQDDRRLDATREALIARTGNAEIHCERADLSSLSEVRALGERLAACGPVDLLLNNAGAVFGLSRRESVDGLELTFALNHLAYFQLTSILLSQLHAASQPRVVNVASNAWEAAGGRFPFDDPQAVRRYRPGRQYGVTKLANILFTHELARRVGPEIHCVSWSPKRLTATRFAYGAHWSAPLLMKLTHPFSMSPAKAARPLIALCCEPIDVELHGRFVWGDHRSEVSACNDADARRLWEMSEELVGARA